MAVPAARPKFPVVYTSNNGQQYSYNHVQDIIDAGAWPSGAAGPHPSKGKLRPRHFRCLAQDGSKRSFTVPVATQGAWDSIAAVLGGAVTYGGVACKITSVEGEKEVR